VTDNPLDDRKFTDGEVREILKRAVESTPSKALRKMDGHSLADLKAIGAEVGIDPIRLEEAARAVALAGTNRSHPIWGAPTTLHFERSVQGEMDPHDAPDALSVIRRITGHHGEVNVIQESLEWSARTDLVNRYVTLSPRNGKTTIRASANLSNAVVIGYLPLGLMGLIVSVASLIEFVQDGGVVPLVVALTVLPILLPTIRALLGKLARSETAKLHGLVDELARLTEESDGAEAD
jgi:hypothetical protein